MTMLPPKFDDALSYASRLHRGQIRKGTTIAYVAHLLGVASIALEHGASEDEAIGALLHDALEEGDTLPTAAEGEGRTTYDFLRASGRAGCVCLTRALS